MKEPAWIMYQDGLEVGYEPNEALQKILDSVLRSKK